MGSLVLLGTAITLGLRHGIDWDHIAALVDISGASSKSADRTEAVILSLFYALGHAFIVVLLGLTAISFAAILPAWLDLVMERIVGFTLLLLGFYLCYAVFQANATRGEFKMQSRWMFLIAACKFYVARLTGRPQQDQTPSLGAGSAFSIGTLHGLGAETGTQVLLIAAVGGASAHGLAIPMLLAFALGLIISNTIVALLAASSFASAARLRPLYLFAGGTAALFSLFVGLFFVLGHAGSLPSLGI